MPRSSICCYVAVNKTREERPEKGRGTASNLSGSGGGGQIYLFRPFFTMQRYWSSSFFFGISLLVQPTTFLAKMEFIYERHTHWLRLFYYSLRPRNLLNRLLQVSSTIRFIFRRCPQCRTQKSLPIHRFLTSISLPSTFDVCKRMRF